MHVCVMCGGGGSRKKEAVLRAVRRALTDDHVITVRKSMLLDLRLPHTFISLAAGHTDVEESASSARA